MLLHSYRPDCLWAKRTKQPEAAAAPTTLDGDADRFNYGLGMVIGERVLKQYGEIDYNLLIAGMKAKHQSQEALITIEDATATLTAHAENQFAAQTEANKTKGANYLAKNAKKGGVVVTASGLQYSVITQGDGPKPMPTDQVTVHYRGILIDGTEFDSSYARGEPATVGLNQVIPGWTEGVQLLNVGSKYQFVVPYELAWFRGPPRCGPGAVRDDPGRHSNPSRGGDRHALCMSGADAALTPTGCEAPAATFAAIPRYATALPVTHTRVWNSGQTTLLISSPSSPAQTRGLAGGHDCRRHMGCDLFAGGRTPFRKSP